MVYKNIGDSLSGVYFILKSAVSFLIFGMARLENVNFACIIYNVDV